MKLLKQSLTNSLIKMASKITFTNQQALFIVEKELWPAVVKIEEITKETKHFMLLTTLPFILEKDIGKSKEKFDDIFKIDSLHYPHPTGNIRPKIIIVSTLPDILLDIRFAYQAYEVAPNISYMRLRNALRDINHLIWYSYITKCGNTTYCETDKISTDWSKCANCLEKEIQFFKPRLVMFLDERDKRYMPIQEIVEKNNCRFVSVTHPKLLRDRIDNKRHYRKYLTKMIQGAIRDS